MRKCWHCSRTVDTNEPYDVIPLSIKRREDGKYVFEGPGYFHFNMQCMLAALYDRWEKMRMRGIENAFSERFLRPNLLAYAKIRHGLDKLPPPAANCLLLEDYGGPLSWQEWRAFSWKNESEWDIAEYIKNESTSFYRDEELSPLINNLPIVIQVPFQKHVPGKTDILLQFFS